MDLEKYDEEESYDNLLKEYENAIPKTSGLRSVTSGRMPGARNRHLLMYEQIEAVGGKGMADHLLLKAIELACGKSQNGDLGMIQFLLDKMYVRPQHKSFVKFNLGDLDKIEDLKKEFKNILHLISESELSIEDGSQICDRLLQLKTFILGTEIEGQYYEVLEEMQNRGYNLNKK